MLYSKNVLYTENKKLNPKSFSETNYFEALRRKILHNIELYLKYNHYFIDCFSCEK